MRHRHALNLWRISLPVRHRAVGPTVSSAPSRPRPSLFRSNRILHCAAAPDLLHCAAAPDAAPGGGGRRLPQAPPPNQEEEDATSPKHRRLPPPSTDPAATSKIHPLPASRRRARINSPQVRLLLHHLPSPPPHCSFVQSFDLTLTLTSHESAGPSRSRS